MRKTLYWALIGIFSLIFVLSAYIVIDYYAKGDETEEQWKEVQNWFWDTEPSTGTTGFPLPQTSLGDPTTAPTVPTVPPTTLPVVTNPTATQPSTTVPPTQGGQATTTPVPPTTEPTTPTEPATEPTTAPTVPPTEPPTPPTTVAPTTTVPETTDVKKTILARFEKLLKANSDVVGYLYIEDIVNYPILHHPEERDYYIDRNFYGNYDKRGCIYLREACDMDKPTDVLTIYGHAMADGQMFGMLNRYLYKSFFNSHQTFTMWDLYGEHTYQVVCVFKTSGTYGVGFPFHLFDDFANEAEYEEFINGVRDLAIHDSGVETQYGDQFVCLCTCEYTLTNGRLVVVAKRIS